MRFTREQIDRMEQRGNICHADAEFLRGAGKGRVGELIKVAPKAERTFNGRVYASKTEMLRGKELTFMQDRGELTFRHQPRYELGVKENRFTADFEVTDRNGKTWVEEIKGYKTKHYKKNERLWASYGPHDLLILKRKGNGWDREVVKGGAAK